MASGRSLGAQSLSSAAFYLQVRGLLKAKLPKASAASPLNPKTSDGFPRDSDICDR